MENDTLYKEIQKEIERIYAWHKKYHEKEFGCSCSDMIEQFKRFEKRLKVEYKSKN